jgi:hypothetical protein
MPKPSTSVAATSVKKAKVSSGLVRSAHFSFGARMSSYAVAATSEA